MPVSNPVTNCIIVGKGGSGKSTLIKNLIDENKTFAFDLQGEYKNGFRGDIDEFKNIAVNLKNKIIVFEEATIFFNHKNSDTEMLKLIISCRHKGNTLLFTFHSILAIPLWILTSGFIKTMFIFKTDDLNSRVHKKFEDLNKLTDAYQKVFESKNPHEFKIVQF